MSREFKKEMEKIFKKAIKNYEKGFYRMDKKTVQIALNDVKPYQEYYDKLKTVWNEFELNKNTNNAAKVMELMNNIPNEGMK
ncbi:hypothetical protein [Clostridium sp.]|uniref:hypothetical protein n=1 Tax=Clostridium sp. TaxID=1506 RepID=UPI002FCB7337